MHVPFPEDRTKTSRNGSSIITGTTSHEVRSAIYADDIAIFACGPTEVGYLVRASIQTAVDAVDEYLASIGLLSTAKTEALMVHPRAARARFEVPPLTLRGRPLPWRKSVRYLGLQIDCRLNFNAAVSHLCRESLNVASAARSLLARGRGCTPHLGLRVYNSVATSRALYALPLTNARAANWSAIDTEHRNVVRMLYGLPHSSQMGTTLAEAGNWPPSLRAKKQALHHIERLQRSLQGQRLVCRLHSLPKSGMGRQASEYALLIDSSPQLVALPQLPHASSLLKGNEHADALAKEAHAERFPLSPLVTSSDSARTTILRSLSAQHPDARVASAAARTLYRLGGIGSGVCANCADMETLEHLLLHCPAFGVERAELKDSYRRYGLPANSLKDLLFPDAHSSLVKRQSRTACTISGVGAKRKTPARSVPANLHSTRLVSDVLHTIVRGDWRHNIAPTLAVMAAASSLRARALRRPVGAAFRWFRCALCGRAHLTAAKDCNNKLKRIRPRGKPAPTTAPKTQRHPRPRWFSSEREDSDSDYSESSMTYRSRSGSSPRSRSRSCSRPRPHFRSPRRRSQSTSKQQQQGAPIIAAPKDKGSQQNQRRPRKPHPRGPTPKNKR
ncbi:hypothetical protein HPB49_008870 [Dermacentor silvarum]|uniref:Uncharacterized protein n=1 Tax=Dermacentor silvarum TaxID=543639 RepID=A0ACB8DYA4_DERSI|nr:hypothetical protein HPB49_008870 [Dermacentor silvarum]